MKIWDFINGKDTDLETDDYDWMGTDYIDDSLVAEDDEEPDEFFDENAAEAHD
jgi:hypothetical protein